MSVRVAGWRVRQAERPVPATQRAFIRWILRAHEFSQPRGHTK